MSKPQDIPQDVWDAARSAIEAAIAEPGWNPQVIVSRAILAERERCALLAENFETTDILPFCGKMENECAQVGQEYAGDMLAEAIRKRGEFTP